MKFDACSIVSVNLFMHSVFIYKFAYVYIYEQKYAEKRTKQPIL